MLAAHPLADLFPMIDGPEFERFVADIAAHGQREPVVLLDGMILDGRNRAKACDVLGIAPVTTEFDGGDPLGFVLSLNLRRRHLSVSQRAMIAARLESLKPGMSRADALRAGEGRRATDRAGSTDAGAGGKDAKLHVSRADAAAMFDVSARSVADARKVIDAADGSVMDAVDHGRLAVDVAAKVARLDKPDQAAILERSTTDKGLDGRRVGQEIKKAARAARERALGARQLAAPGGKQFGVVYADPPWRFKPFSDETGMDRAADNHYPTQPLSVIKTHRPATADDAVLFLWAKGNAIDEALELMGAWGFSFKSSMVWDKVSFGNGYWVRDRHELLLIGTKGNPPAPAPGENRPSVHAEKATEHSVKPIYFRDMIEDQFPTMPKLEMYCRDPAPGWDAWGFEAEGVA